MVSPPYQTPQFCSLRELVGDKSSQHPPQVQAGWGLTAALPLASCVTTGL